VIEVSIVTNADQLHSLEASFV